MAVTVIFRASPGFVRRKTDTLIVSEFYRTWNALFPLLSSV